MATQTARKRTTKRATPAKTALKPVPDVDEDLADLDPVDPPTVDSHTVMFDFEKETSGTWRYKERVLNEGDLPVIGTLYVKKTAIREMGEPAVMTLTITAGEPA